MMIVFVTMVCASVAIPLVAIAWACRPVIARTATKRSSPTRR